MSARPWTDERLQLGEGLRWVDGRLVLVDMLRGRLLEHNGREHDPFRQLAQLDVPLGAVAPMERTSSWIAAAGAGIAFLHSDGQLEWIDRSEESHRGRTRMNDGACDPAGRFWAGSMAYDGHTPLASLYRVDPDGLVTRVLDEIAIANGPAFTVDGNTMTLADSGRRTITRYSIDTQAGTITDRQQIVALTPDEGTPDGMVIDDQGTLWVAIWGGGCIRRYNLDGELLAEIHLPTLQPTSIVIARERLFVTTAALGQADAAAGRLYAIDMDTHGISATSRPAGTFQSSAGRE